MDADKPLTANQIADGIEEYLSQGRLVPISKTSWPTIIVALRALQQQGQPAGGLVSMPLTTINHLMEYWNGNRNDAAMWDALNHIMDELESFRLSTAPPAPEARGDYKTLYMELLYAVAQKYPGESRHETALRSSTVAIGETPSSMPQTASIEGRFPGDPPPKTDADYYDLAAPQPIELGDVRQYLKAGETVAECIARNRADTDIVLGELAKEKFKSEKLERELSDVRFTLRQIREQQKDDYSRAEKAERELAELRDSDLPSCWPAGHGE